MSLTVTASLGTIVGYICQVQNTKQQPEAPTPTPHLSFLPASLLGASHSCTTLTTLDTAYS